MSLSEINPPFITPNALQRFKLDVGRAYKFIPKGSRYDYDTSTNDFTTRLDNLFLERDITPQSLVPVLTPNDTKVNYYALAGQSTVYLAFFQFAEIYFKHKVPEDIYEFDMMRRSFMAQILSGGVLIDKSAADVSKKLSELVDIFFNEEDSYMYHGFKECEYRASNQPSLRLGMTTDLDINPSFLPIGRREEPPLVWARINYNSPDRRNMSFALTDGVNNSYGVDLLNRRAVQSFKEERPTERRSLVNTFKTAHREIKKLNKQEPSSSFHSLRQDMFVAGVVESDQKHSKLMLQAAGTPRILLLRIQEKPNLYDLGEMSDGLTNKRLKMKDIWETKRIGSQKPMEFETGMIETAIQNGDKIIICSSDIVETLTIPFIYGLMQREGLTSQELSDALVHLTNAYPKNRINKSNPLVATVLEFK